MWCVKPESLEGSAESRSVTGVRPDTAGSVLPLQAGAGECSFCLHVSPVFSYVGVVLITLTVILFF